MRGNVSTALPAASLLQTEYRYVNIGGSRAVNRNDREGRHFQLFTATLRAAVPDVKLYSGPWDLLF